MGFEVEVKAPCPKDIARRLAEAEAEFVREERQDDAYFNHPVRDFKVTDEALRVRKIGRMRFLTYKGPKLSKRTKMREEYEVPVGEGICEILIRLGFRQSLTVSKTRRYYRLEGFDVCVDEVEGLGAYIEVESPDTADEEKILALMERLGLSPASATTKSYLELIEEKAKCT